MPAQALFYPASYASQQVAGLLHGLGAEALDVVDFSAEKGGSEDQQLAVPLLRGMDEIEVEEARIVLRASPKSLDIEDYSVKENAAGGVFLSLPTAARLRKVEVSFDYTPPVPSPTTRLVLRAATPAGSGFTPGVPLFCAPDFGAAGAMYGPVLGGMTVTDLGNERRLLALPSVLGSAWLIQLAAGDGDPTKLVPLRVKLSVTRVTLDAAPQNLTVVLAAQDGEIKLWNNPGPLLPEAGEQEVSFTPLAQKHLAHALKSMPASTVTLPVPLRFRTDSAGAIQITDRSLKSEYVVRPLGREPVTLRLGGQLTPLTLSAPVALAPKRGTMRLTAKLLGRELNDDSSVPNGTTPAKGLRVATARSVAAALDVAPLGGKQAGSVLDLASARAYIAATQEAEVVLEIRSDLAAAPGPVAIQPVVKQVERGFSGWLEFEFAKPLTVVAGQAPVWVALRVNKGEVLWFAADGTAERSRTSADRGKTWGAPDLELAPPGCLLAQIFHSLPDPLPAPVIRLQRGGAILTENLLSSPSQTGAREYHQEAFSLPESILDALGRIPGNARAPFRLDIFSRSVLDLTVDDMVLCYDPFQPGRAGAGV